MLTETATMDTNTSTGTNQSNTSGCAAANSEAKLLEAFLCEVIRMPAGLTIHVETEITPRLILGGVISNVRTNSAWVAFSVDKISYRTKTIEDRHNFCAWYQSDNPEGFSKKKGEETIFGPPDVTFVRMLGLSGS